MAYGQGQYGLLPYSAEPDQDGEGSTLKPDLMRYLPQYYEMSPTMIELQDAIAEDLGRLYASIDDTLDQFFVDTATWGLDKWERELGLPTDTSQPFVRRREMVKAKLRGAGTTTPEMIQRVASAFSGGDVRVENVPGEYRFIVRFVGILGIPPNMAGLIKILDEIKPAHLAYEFAYTYTTWDMVEAALMSWDDAESLTWDEIEIWGG